MEPSTLEQHLQKLQKVLELEKRQGYQDNAVLGGLEGYIVRFVGESGDAAQQLLSLIRGYGNKPREQRRLIVQEIEDGLRALQTGAPIAPRAATKEASALPSPVRFAKGVGPAREKLLQKLGVRTIEDLLTYFPRRIEDRSEVKRIAQLRAGERATVVGRVRAVDVIKPKRGMEILKVAVQDNTGVVYAVWFNQPWLKNQIVKGESIALYGELDRGYGQMQMQGPVWESAERRFLTGRLVPIYPATEGITPATLYRLISENLALCRPQIAELLPDSIRERHGLWHRPDAIAKAHQPANLEEFESARRSLAFEELFLFQLGVAAEKRKNAARSGRSLQITDERLEEFYERLPFQLTPAQQQAIREIRSDLARPVPMSRLLQGDVGAGKTVVAALACLIAIDAGYQAAFMAPTEILARQHLRNLQGWFHSVPDGPRIAGLLGSLSAKEKAEISDSIRAGEADLVIGTHALIEEAVEFKRLGLAVIDEQHRFGVIQRAELEKKGDNLDLLVMTATPIPRTITLTLYGHFDISVIDQLPYPRRIQTHWISEDKREQVYELIAQELKKGAQAYVVYPLIEESEELDLQAATTMKEELSQAVFKELRVGLLHGRMGDDEKQRVMAQLRNRELDVLVSTTIVEVGIDVPDASIMVIEHAERFGLSQLHQLRGRVGRTGQKAYCFAIATAKTEDAQSRLEAFRDIADGFRIAEEDLKIRGPGELLGVAQHGLDTTFRAAQLFADYDLMKAAREEAFALVDSQPDHPLMAEFARRFGQQFDLTRV